MPRSGASICTIEARGDDRFVFAAQRFGDRLQVFVGGLVVVVGLKQRDHARRGGIEERIGGRARRDTPREVREILLQRRERLVADVADATRPAVFRRRAELGQFLEQPRKFDQVLAGLARRIAIEPRETIGDIRGVADLAHLAVADHVDTGGDLLPDHRLDGIRDHL